MMRSALVLVLLCTAVAAQAATVTLAWDPNSETIAGYRLYYGATPTAPFNGDLAAEGSSPVDIPLESLADPANPTFSLTGVAACHLLYFALTAYDADGNESDFSNTVSTMVVPKASDLEGTDVGLGALELAWAGFAPEDQKRLNRVLVHYGPAPGDYTGKGAAQGDSPVTGHPVSSSVILTGLQPGQQIYVMVEAVCPSGDSRKSDELMATAGTEGEPPSHVLQVGCAMAAGGARPGSAVLPLALLLLVGWRRSRGC